MNRFYQWLEGFSPDFWRTYFQHPELISLLRHINSIAAAKTAGYKLLQGYDIVDIGEHLPGNMLVWERIKLRNHRVRAGTEYPHKYDIDIAWLHIDSLHDKHTDSELRYQNKIDFILEAPGVLAFVREPELDTLYISKGLYSGTRLSDDIGKAFGYSRYDSFSYRDNMVPLLALFYEGPTYKNLKAATTIMVNSPVAKYGDEKVISNTDNIVITNKYRYDLGGAKLRVPVGSRVGKHIPFVKATELYTDKTHPGWWEDRVPQLFQKYAQEELTSKTRDLLMETFLRRFVAHMRINLNEVDWRTFVFQPDVLDLFLDGSPLRTDYILSAYFKWVDLDMPMPNFELPKVRSRTYCIWGFREVEGQLPGEELWLHAPSLVQPRIIEDVAGSTEAVDNPGASEWWVGNTRYHILSPNSGVDEFWSQHRFYPEDLTKPLLPYVEPNMSRWAARLINALNEDGSYKTIYEATGIPLNQELSMSFGVPMPSISFGAVRGRQDSSVISEINDNPGTLGYQCTTVPGDLNIYYHQLDEWDSTSCHLGIDGIVCKPGEAGVTLSPEYSFGIFPKQLYVKVVKTTPKNTTLTAYCSQGGSEWKTLPDNGVLKNVSGNLRFKVVLAASAVSSPILHGIDITARLQN